MSDANLADRQTSDPDRTFPVRKIDFSETIEQLERDFLVDGDVIMSHLMAALSGVFPDGEQLFIDAVKAHRDQVTDPDLLRQVNAFIGQEVTHGREHRRLNEKLGALGYRSQMVEASMAADSPITPAMRRIIWLASRVGPFKGIDKAIDEQDKAAREDPLFQLSLTAALEHYTATMAEVLLSDPMLYDLAADEGFFKMWAWHATEECEHKAVAFDVYKAVGGDEETRLRGMRMASLALIFISGYHTVAGVLRDRRTYGPGIIKSIRRLRKNPLLSKEFPARVADYNRADFHPLQHDTTALEATWIAWLDDEGAAHPLVTA